jgi:hypothetical protein
MDNNFERRRGGEVKLKQTSLIGVAFVAVAIFACFAYSFYQTNQLQSQVTRLQSQVTNFQQQWQNVTQAHIIVLSYTWDVQPLFGTFYQVHMNATLFNDNPLNNTAYVANIYAQFQNKTAVATSYMSGFPSYVTTNAHFTLTYNASDYNMASPDAAWLEFS